MFQSASFVFINTKSCSKIWLCLRNQKYSITNEEIKTAIEHNKQVYVFIDRDVDAEYQTYLKNKDKDIEYSHVDDKRIFEFIEEIRSLKRNNIIHPFYSSNEIITFLREQWAGLLHQYLQEQSRYAQTDTLNDLRETLGMAKDLTDLLVSANESQSKNISEVLFANHPVFAELRKAMNWKFPIIFHSLSELGLLLEPWGYKYLQNSVKQNFYEFANSRSGYDLFVLKVLFDNEGGLMSSYPPSDDELVIKEKHFTTADDLPF